MFNGKVMFRVFLHLGHAHQRSASGPVSLQRVTVQRLGQTLGKSVGRSIDGHCQLNPAMPYSSEKTAINNLLLLYIISHDSSRLLLFEVHQPGGWANRLKALTDQLGPAAA